MINSIQDEVVAVVGLGYVGLPLVISLANSGRRVIGIDLNKEIVDGLTSELSHIEDISNEEIKRLNRGKLVEYTTEFKKISEVSVVFICVPTPLDSTGRPDLAFLTKAIDSCSPYLQNDSLVINESTSYPGTLRNLIMSRALERSSAQRIQFAVAPERINPGTKDFRREDIPRVVGAISEAALTRATRIYEDISESVFSVSNAEVAELSKLLENSYRQINISFINEFNNLCRKIGIDTREVIRAASTKPYGFQPFYPGAGIGGHCIPVDPIYLQDFASQMGMSLRMIESARVVNSDVPNSIVMKVVESVGGNIESMRILLLGVAYKPDIGDTRETPALAIADHLTKLKAELFWIDDYVKDWAYPKALRDEKWDIAILVTNHTNVDYSNFINRTKYFFDVTGHLSDNAKVIQL